MVLDHSLQQYILLVAITYQLTITLEQKVNYLNVNRSWEQHMTQSILFIHGAGEGAYDEDSKLAASLQQSLGDAFTVTTPQMPNENAPEYDAWKEQISNELGALGEHVILVGHSFGGSVLLKYLTEEKLSITVDGVFLIATPFYGVKDWDYDLYKLADDFANKLPKKAPITLYHSKGDEWVPFEHMSLYASKLPQATVREFEGRGHQFNDDLKEVAADIAAL